MTTLVGVGWGISISMWRILKNFLLLVLPVPGAATFWYIIGILRFGRFGATETQHEHSNGAALDAGCQFGAGCMMN